MEKIMDVFITLDGVLNTSQSKIKYIEILSDKVVMLNDFIRQHKHTLWIINPTSRTSKKRFDQYLDSLEFLGLTVKFKRIYTNVEAANIIKKQNISNFIVITSEPTLRNGGTAVIYTNKQTGLQQTDITKITKK